MSNFKFPYFSRNIGEFWRRWHISLSTWFRDYLYIPLGGSKKGKWISLRNVLIIFLVSGFWHGANWTFIVWGLFHSILFIPSFVFKTSRKYVNSVIAENSFMPSPKEFIQVGTTFILVTIGWVFFRSETIGDSFNYIINMTQNFQIPKLNYAKYLVFILVLLIADWNFKKDERLEKGEINIIFFGMVAVYLVSKIIMSVNTEFIYFEF